LQLLLVGGSVGLAFDHSRQDAPEFADAEEPVAAGIAAVSGKSKPALQKNEGTIFHSLAGDMLDIEIAAAGTVRKALQDGGHSPCLKSPIATVATPRAQASPTEYKIEYSVAMRAKTILTATLGTNHDCSEAVAQHTEKPVRGQDGDNTDGTWRLNSDGSVAVRHLKPAAQPSGMDIVALLGDNFAHTMRQAPRPRRLNEFDPEYAR
jgi:hypothetical protein